MPPGTGTCHLNLALASGDLIERAPHRWRRGHRARGLRLAAKDADIGNGLATVSGHHRNVDEHPAAFMDRDEPAASHGFGQLGGEPDTISRRRGAMAPA